MMTINAFVTEAVLDDAYAWLCWQRPRWWTCAQALKAMSPMALPTPIPAASLAAPYKRIGADNNR